MARLKLKYKGLAEIVDSNGLGIITLTDESASRAINFICDNATIVQLHLREKKVELSSAMLPEVLVSFLGDYVEIRHMEVTIYDIQDGQYQVTLTNSDHFSIRRIRLSDAVLLHLIAGVPIYIEERLMDSQSVALDDQAETGKLSIPINSLDTDKLRYELQRAVEIEDYRLASYINAELKKRNN